MISPDDIWITIMLYFSEYINNNSEKLRDKFVNHTGKKNLIIKEFAGSVEESLLLEKKWDYFFTEIIKKIKENTKEGVVDKLKCDFTTTDDMYELASTSTVMSSMKEYFGYGRMICMCGINNVYFKGCEDDWLKLLDKILELGKYDVDGMLTQYINKVNIILHKFYDTFNNKVDVSFWNNIVQSEEVRVGSGGDIDTRITGWILHFYGIYNTTTFEEMEMKKTQVPVKLYNEFTNTSKDLLLETYFSNICRIGECTYTPRLRVEMIVKKETNGKDDFFEK